MILKDDLIRVVKKQQAFLNKEMGIPREMQIKLLPKFTTIVSGVRRCGKSTLVKQFVQDKRPVYFANFEDINFATFDLQDFNKLEDVFIKELGTGGTFFFDEIQNVKGWEKYIRQLVDNGERIIITGSNASMLSSDLGTRLTGRHITKELHPFSYREFLTLLKVNHSLDNFSKYLNKGGFPEYLKTDENEMLTNLFQDIFYRDVLQRNELRSETAIKTLVQFVISNIGKVFSFNKIKNLIGVGSVNTVSQFFDHLEQAYLLFTIKKFDYSAKKQIANPKKIYCIDNAIIGKNSFSFSENKGRLLENLVFIEFKRRGQDVFYYRDRYECDFVIFQNGRIVQAIQVSFELNMDNRDREINGLIEAMNTFNLDRGKLLTFDQEDTLHFSSKSIEIKPVWKWLLEESPF